MNGDAGSGSVLVLALGALLAVVVMAVGLVATGLATHRQAVRAADLAALAGAQRSLTERVVACDTARQVAQANGAELMTCVLHANTLRVEVSVASSALLPTIGASALAGPAIS